MNKRLIHKKFKLNGISFKSSQELISYVSDQSIEGLEFLISWFDHKDFIVVQTSGSTGKPKKIKIKKEQMLNSAGITGVYFNLKEGTTALLCMSSNYIAGKMMWVRAMSLGWELDVVKVNSHPLANRNKSYDFGAMVPLQVSNSISNLNQINTLIVGGGVVSKELQDELQQKSTKVYATYGMTETVTHIAVKNLNQKSTDSKSDNYKVLPGVSISKDKRGCLVIDAPLVSDEKVVTNDLVELVSEHEFQWLGRYDSIVNSGGVKLIPELIEKKIKNTVSEKFFIAGKPDSFLGEKLILIVEGNQSIITEKKMILQFLSGADLLPFEIPKEIYFDKEFAMTETGKIRRSFILNKIL